jgi:hypothetical protein
MKKIQIIVALFFNAILLQSCVSTKFQASPPPISVNFENETDKNTNYVLANEWMVETFNSAESVIQFADKESGIIKGKYVLRAGYVSTSPYVASRAALNAIITIRLRDNACRIEIAPPSSGFYSQSIGTTEYGYPAIQFDEDARNLINNFRDRMKAFKSGTEW